MWKEVHIFFLLIGQTTVVDSEKLFFNSINSKFSDCDSKRSNNTTPTSARVKKDSTLIYAAMAIPTQQYNYKQVVESKCPELHVLERSRSRNRRVLIVEL